MSRGDGLQRRIYGAAIRLHPAAFREEFGREMALDFEDALEQRGFAPLLGDAMLSLARQWTACALTGLRPDPAAPQPASGHPFLAGQYAAVDRGHLSFFDWGCASLVSTLLLLTIGFAASVPNRRAVAAVQTVRASHDGGVGAGGNGPSPGGSTARRERPGAAERPTASGRVSGANHGIARLGWAAAPVGWGRRAHGDPHAARPITLTEALVQLILISAIVWVTALFFRRSAGIGRRAALATLGLLAVAASVAFGQAPVPPIHAQILHASGPLPSYEVATIKPWDGKGYGFPLRSYILGAFNLPPSAVTRLIGPEWIDKASYVIQGKASDAERDAMQKMTPQERGREMRLMQQALLADRFNLKVHFETREMPLYDLVVTKDGPKLKEIPNPVNGGAVLRNKGQMEELKGNAMPLTGLIGLLMGTADIDGRTVIDRTGLTGAYDVLLDWVPSRLGANVQPGSLIQPGNYGAEPSSTDGPSLFTALEEQLGLKLVATKGPVEVIVIDHIERPSEN